MQSMTGYAFVEKSTDQFSFSVEIKALNSRYLEIYLNYPRILKNEDAGFNSVLKESFDRGKIELNIEIFNWETERPVNLNPELIKKYYTELSLIHSDLRIAEPLKFESVLSLEGIIHRERTYVSEKSMSDMYSTIRSAVKKTIEMRKSEGASTQKDLLKSLSVISGGLLRIKSLSKNIARDKNELLRKRIESLSGGSIDDVRLLSELAILADKIDTNEETMRLSDHIKKFKSLCSEKGQVGKKLDFLAQEMFREINTIASKSNSSEASHVVVDMKDHVEKIREQCRNIV